MNRDYVEAGNDMKSSLPASNGSSIILKNITKTFGHVVANNAVNLKVEAGTIHGIVGENGAGKSTLMNILFGLYQPNTGNIFIDQQPVVIKSPDQSITLGIGMVHQHFMLVPTFTVLENVMLGNEGSFYLDKGSLLVKNQLNQLSNKYDLRVDPDSLISDLPVGMQQRVEILKALNRGAKILILDEPTGVLTPQETEGLFTILSLLKEKGVTIILITHKLKEIMRITEHVSVMRQGELVASFKTNKTSPEELAEKMVGRKVLLDVGKKQKKVGTSSLKVSNLTHYSKEGVKVLDDISFTISKGEILGVAGVAGNGQSDLLDVLSGVESIQEGEITVNSLKISCGDTWNPKVARSCSIAHVPEDRQKRGLVLSFFNYENIILGYHHQARWMKGLILNGKKILKFFDKMGEQFDIRPRSPLISSSKLSGGNQQKLVLAREIESKPDILLVGQPTRGVDIGAIERIYGELLELRNQGTAILLVSVELDEIMSLSDRIIVMNQGRLVGEVRGSDANELEIGKLMSGLEEELVN